MKEFLQHLKISLRLFLLLIIAAIGKALMVIFVLFNTRGLILKDPEGTRLFSLML
ncbi:MAG: Cell division protein FtsL [Idiomarinaceae bacterium HL-53]|nr:MAG: Cell division protein FtsL [Idiomarinaceae bacterium HL-53]